VVRSLFALVQTRAHLNQDAWRSGQAGLSGGKDQLDATVKPEQSGIEREKFMAKGRTRRREEAKAGSAHKQRPIQLAFYESDRYILVNHP